MTNARSDVNCFTPPPLPGIALLRRARSVVTKPSIGSGCGRLSSMWSAKDVQAAAGGLLPVEVYDRLYRVGAECAGLMVEIGTAHGAGTIALASGAASSGKPYRIVTVDPFGGALSSRTKFGSPEQNYETVEKNLEQFGVRDCVEVVTGTIEDIRHRDDLEGISVLLVDADGRVDRDLGALYERLHPDAVVVLDDIDNVVEVHAINRRSVVSQKHRITAHLVQGFLVAGVLRDAERVCDTGFYLKGTAHSSAIAEAALPAYRELVFTDLGPAVSERPPRWRQAAKKVPGATRAYHASRRLLA